MAARLTAYLVATIVAATLIAGLIVGAQRDTEGPVDLVIVNGKVFTAAEDASAPTAEAVAVQGNKILRVGTTREIQRLARAQTAVIDARGGSILPGFNDAGVDLVRGGLHLARVSVARARTLDDLGSTLQAWAHGHREAAWIVARDWSGPVGTAPRPTRQLLDTFVADRPVVVLSADRRVAWANTAALREAGFTRRMAVTDDGVTRDAVSGEATGILRQGAVTTLLAHVPQPTRAERLAAVRHAVGEAHRRGVTSVQTTVGSRELLDELADLRDQDALSLRVSAAVTPAGPSVDEVAALDEWREAYPDDPQLKAGSLLLDGQLPGLDTARPAGTGSGGADGLTRLVADAEARGWQVIVRADGDDALERAVAALDRPSDAEAETARAHRHRLALSSMVDLEDARRLSRIGVTAAVDPMRDASGDTRDGWPGPPTNWSAVLSALHTLTSTGGHIVFASGWPDAELDPLQRVRAAIETRLTTAPGGDTPRAVMSLARALAAYTREAAWSAFDDQRKGQIAPDMLADIVVLSHDLFALAPDALDEAAVTVTIFDGKVVYEREIGANH